MRSNSTSPCPHCGRPKVAHAKQCRACFRAPRELIDNGDGTYTVPLSRGAAAIIDAVDAPMVRQYRWALGRARNRPDYAVRQHGGVVVYLHRAILGVAEGEFVDHINRNGLDCRRSNLRRTTPQGNMANVGKRSTTTNPYKGVRLRCDRKRWTARIQCDGRGIHIGSFDTAEEAAQAYDDAARKLFGEFAGLNFPEAA